MFCKQVVPWLVPVHKLWLRYKNLVGEIALAIVFGLGLVLLVVLSVMYGPTIDQITNKQTTLCVAAMASVGIAACLLLGLFWLMLKFVTSTREVIELWREARSWAKAGVDAA